MALLLRILPSLLVCVFLHDNSAWAKVDVTMPKVLEAYRGESVELTCNYTLSKIKRPPSNITTQWFVETPAEPFGKRWRIFYDNSKIKVVDKSTNYSERMDVRSGIWGTHILIRDLQVSDNREFFCQVNGMEAGFREGKTQLKVFSPPTQPAIEGVTTPIPVNNLKPSKVASCETRNGYPKPNITWYKDRRPLTPDPQRMKVDTLTTKHSDGLFAVHSTLEYQVTREDKYARFSCVVSYFVPGSVWMLESNTVHVLIHYPTTTLELKRESPPGLVIEGDTVTLRCVGNGMPPPSYFFIKIEASGSMSNLESKGDVATLNAVSRNDSAIYQCRVRSNKTLNGDHNLTVHYLDPAVVVPKDLEVMLIGEDLTATCNALSSLETSTVWFKDNQQVGTGNTLHLNNATYNTSGEYTCEVTCPSMPDLHTRGSVHIVVQGGPQLVGVQQEVQQGKGAGRMVNLICEAVGHPLPSITWNIDGSQSWHEVVSNTSDHKTRSVVSVKGTSNISALCNASNDIGTDIKYFSIEAIGRVTPAAPFQSAEGNGVIIAVIVMCLVMLAIIGGIVYCLHKKGKLSRGRSGKKEITKEKNNKEDVVVEMRMNTKKEEAVLLKAINGDKNGHHEQ
ncbi:cell surface glycoprotein MUC18-like isoform X2 [Antennarius striatus]